jgi:hypothetical protein
VGLVLSSNMADKRKSTVEEVKHQAIFVGDAFSESSFPTDTEGEDDLDRPDLQKLNEAVVAASDWTAETIVRQMDRGNININPSFQRRDAWSAGRKSKFIESLILGLPIPQLVLAENKNQKGSYLVIDGKQRLLSLRQFSAKPDDQHYSQLKLIGLDIRKDLAGKTLDDLENDPLLADELRAFQNQTIRTVVIKGWPNESILYLIFLRLNTGSVPLSPQELRQALHPGPFLEFVEESSGSSRGLQTILKISKPDFRMRDAELVIRYFAFRNFLPAYRGNLKAFLDKTCSSLNKDWESFEGTAKSQLRDMETALQASFEIFGTDNAFRKWSGGKYEGRFNRAIFDAMIFYLSDSAVAGRAVAARKGIESDFKSLCESNQQFVKSIEATTKSLDATANRLQIWGDTLSRRLKLNLRIPRLQNDEIVIP